MEKKQKYTTFEQMKLNKSLMKSLNENGFQYPTPIQSASLKPIRSGKDVIGIAQTGTGKTFAYLLPILERLHYAQGNSPRALIIVPTRELVQQVVEAAELLASHCDLRILGIYGGANIRTQSDRVAEGVDLLVATPGRCLDIFYTRVLSFSRVKTLVIDEADRLMDMGFIPQLQSLYLGLPASHQNLLFTATFSAEIAELSKEFLIDPRRVEVTPESSTVKNIALGAYLLPNFYTKINLLKLLLKLPDFEKVMVFVKSKKRADLLQMKLEDEFGKAMGVLHSNKAQNTRFHTLEAFKEGKARILISSDIGARGIDIEDITHIVNFDLPILNEEFVHRVGRTGRAERSGVAISFFTEEEKEQMLAIEKLIKREIEVLELPENLVISEDLLEEERIVTANIRLKDGVRKGGGAFQQKKGNKRPAKRSGSRKKR
ncbi:MAG: DEAD/DEAH box helicase [Flavobacteriaceae bacterium]|nr:DEAD/DEAH box helicase [Flavobacteriaceae bacterium]